MLLEEKRLQNRGSLEVESQCMTSVEVILNEELLCLSHVYSVLI